MKKVPTLLDALNVKLMALHDVEKHLQKALPKMVKLASDTQLRESLAAHVEETRNHVLRLEQCMKILKMKPKRIKGEGIRGIVDDAEWTLGKDMPQDLRDALIIASAQYVEHYEMAGYISAKDWASVLGFTDVALLLSQTLEEEKTADEKLTMIADASIYRRAARI